MSKCVAAFEIVTRELDIASMRRLQDDEIDRSCAKTAGYGEKSLT